IDHNYFNRIGRQFIVTGFEAANSVTISNNYFDGHADFSTGCDGHQYWVGLLAGNGDRITFASNYIFFTAGWPARRRDVRLCLPVPHHYYSSISGHALDIDLGAFAFAEGNHFDNVVQPSTTSVGTLFSPVTSTDASGCTAHLGRACQLNTVVGSG
ncbi:pectin lyase, partial [Mycena vulgaris]